MKSKISNFVPKYPWSSTTADESFASDFSEQKLASFYSELDDDTRLFSDVYGKKKSRSGRSSTSSEASFSTTSSRKPSRSSRREWLQSELAKLESDCSSDESVRSFKPSTVTKDRRGSSTSTPWEQPPRLETSSPQDVSWTMRFGNQSRLANDTPIFRSQVQPRTDLFVGVDAPKSNKNDTMVETEVTFKKKFEGPCDPPNYAPPPPVYVDAQGAQGAGDNISPAEVTRLISRTMDRLASTDENMARQQQAMTRILDVCRQGNANKNDRVDPPEPFSGEKGDDWDSWIEHARWYVTTMKYTMGRASVWLYGRIQKRARKALNMVPEDERRTWDQIEQIMDKRYSSKKRHKSHYRAKWESAQSNHDEATDDFIDRVMEYRLKSEPDEGASQRRYQVQMKVLARHRDGRVRNMVHQLIIQDDGYDDDPWTMEKFRRMLMKHEDGCCELRSWERYGRKEEKPQDKNFKQTNRLSCIRCTGEHFSFDCPFWRLDCMMDGNRPPEDFDEHQSDEWWQERDEQHSDRINAITDRSNLTCYRCGEKGHFARDCQSERQTGAQELERKFQLNQKHTNYSDKDKQMWKEYLRMKDEIRKRFPNEYRNDKYWGANQYSSTDKGKDTKKQVNIITVEEPEPVVSTAQQDPSASSSKN